MPGCSTTRATPSSRGSPRRTAHRLRRDGVSRPRADARTDHASICFIWCASSSTAGGSCAGWTSSGGCWPIRPSRASPRTDRRPGASSTASCAWRPRARAMCSRAPSAAPSSSRRRPRCSFRTPMRARRSTCDGFGLTEREFRLIKEQLEPGSRMFLVKQGHHSVVCRARSQGLRRGARGDLRARTARRAHAAADRASAARIRRAGCPPSWQLDGRMTGLRTRLHRPKGGGCHVESANMVRARVC